MTFLINILTILVILIIFKPVKVIDVGYKKFESNNFVSDFSDIESLYSNKLKDKILGIGGGGVVFQPKFSPFNDKEMAITVDMGGIYISHNAGESWQRKNLEGVVHAIHYDSSRENVLYVGGSGVYKSNDNGRNFELFFPLDKPPLYIVKIYTYTHYACAYTRVYL